MESSPTEKVRQQPESRLENQERLANPIEFGIDQELIANSEGIPPHMKAWISKLPDTLLIDGQFTLFIGENGEGKTQFVRALVAALADNREGANPRSDDMYLDPNEPASFIKPAIKLSSPRVGNVQIGNVNGAEIAERANKAYNFGLENRKEAVTHESNARFHKERGNNESAAWQRERAAEIHELADEQSRSRRQLFEQGLEFHRDRIAHDVGRIFGAPSGGEEITPGEQIILLDEPESGASPNTQKSLPSVIQNFRSHDNSALFVVTHSPILRIDPDTPRLDLDDPQKGIYRPSELSITKKDLVEKLLGKIDE